VKRPHHHQLRVAEVIAETADARSFVLDVPHELSDRFGYRPGQFLTVRIPGPDGGFAARCYSLSSSPPSRQLKITVKRMPAGHGSNWLCDHVDASL
jgi:3-ketosteroid 9alpha-monooxygenase subunit B